MKTLRSIPALLAVLVLASGCPKHKDLNPANLADIHKLAIVVRVAGDAQVSIARIDPGLNRAYPTAAPDQADAALETALKKQVRRFEVRDRLREAVVSKLPPTPPWSTAMPAVQVATALDSLLVEQGLQPIDFGALENNGADAVLQLDVMEWGVHALKGRPAGSYLKGEGRLVRVDGSLLWGGSLDFDELTNPAAEGADLVALRDGGFREAVIALTGKVGERVAAQLAPEK